MLGSVSNQTGDRHTQHVERRGRNAQGYSGRTNVTYNYKGNVYCYCPRNKYSHPAYHEDRRIFTPIDRASYKWEKEYDKRTSVERVNSRLDVWLGFELHTIRGMAKMKLRCGLALCVMLAMDERRIKGKQKEKMRSLVAAA